MPGVIMENGSRNGSHTNHDRDQRLNGLNGASYAMEKGKGREEPLQNVTPVSPPIPNGLNTDMAGGRQNGGDGAIPKDIEAQLDQLPPEILHITQGYLPLSLLLSRLAQKTHNDLARTITDMAQMALPPAVANGNTSHGMSNDDNSQENLSKKLRLLNFAQDAHTEWTKALIITNWSRRSEDVSKMIDLKIHLDKQKSHYDFAINELMEVKRSLVHARLPNPDLKTALAVLTTGKASWMPELGYIQPPPLTAKEILKSLENLNTLLSIRLSLQEYDNIPIHFMDYTIKSGRATFNVAGEFAVDLTIADEDPETQFWFIDFRFLFSPSLPEVPPHVRAHIESRVNEALLKDGLAGRQAVGLARGKWIDGLKVEALNRALSIQYWLDRYGRKGPKSWIILGVHSGRRKVGRPHPKDTSRLFLRWFRDSKEVKEVDIPFDAVDISAESLLKTVIANHVDHILTSTYERLRRKPLFASHEAVLSVVISKTEPAESELKVQLTSDRHLTVRIEPITGRFVLGPSSRLAVEFEFKLNDQCNDPATNAHNLIEEMRQKAVMDDILLRGVSLGWIRVKNPGIKLDDLRSVVPKETSQVLWLQRPGWVKNWYFAVSMSVSGERWWLIETTDPSPDANNAPTARNQKKDTTVKITSSIPIPIQSISPTPSYDFLANLHVFAAALVSHYVNLKALHERRTRHKLQSCSTIPSAVKVPAVYLQLSELIATLGPDKKSIVGKNMALKDIVQLTFQGLETRTRRSKDTQAITSPTVQQTQPSVPAPPPASIIPAQKLGLPHEDVFVMTEARMIFSPPPQALKMIKENIDRDIAFHQTSGAFALRLRSRVGESIVTSLIERVVRIERLVSFIKILQAQEKSIQCKTISLGRITFTYGNVVFNADGDVTEIDGGGPREFTAVVDFSTADNMMTLILERGNPHLEIIDHLTRILNGKEGLDGVATLLPLTLPVLQGLDALEMAWASVPKGQAFVNVRAADWYIIRYDISISPPTGTTSEFRSQKVMFEVRLRHRRGIPWWYIRRTDTRERDGDGIDVALKPVWNTAGKGWQGMRVSGVAQANGVEELLGKLDAALRNFVNSNQTTQAQSVAPVAPMMQPRAKGPARQQQQLPTPNQSQSQSQSQSQGRNNLKREVVEID
ncbi:Mediator of RNA polymerase II transcription subunit [Lachnellula subtilissima]|uniref:Mediator of RNA polymerase II transcription subunit 14 n=1 Tax=Lachnellula subtilissima TaxID=602034 RepID=A0A8H8UAT6_9HELO|nr:Mediator of RNA polymerase II transcription subunit [Lachnellula subtilissima]